MHEKIVENRLKNIPSIFANKESIAKVFPVKEKKEITVDDVAQYYDLSIPDCLDWDVEEVLDWLQNDIKLPQYTETFAKNQINGRYLLFLNASRLPRMNIHDFMHIKIICHGIKELYGIEYEGFDNGDISLLAPKVVRYEYLLFKTRSGSQYDEVTPQEFLKYIYIAIREPQPLKCTWESMDPSKKIKDLKLKVAATGTKRLPGEKKDPTLFVGMENLVSKKFYATKSLKYTQLEK